MSRATTALAAVGAAVAAIDNTDPLTRACVDLAPVKPGLGRKQLAWLRSNIRHFKDMESQRRGTRKDLARSMRLAGLS